jgi:XTP/dITP diphosphohydrolase
MLWFTMPVNKGAFMKIHFITSNAGKAKTLQSFFKSLGRDDIEIVATNLNLIEPQADTVAEVSLFKARQAFNQLKKPVLVEDGGFAIDALNGFPGVYTKYVNQTLGAAGLMKLMNQESNRKAKFVSTATYIDTDGTERQFHRKGGEVSIADKVSNVDSPLAWSVLWKIVWIDRFQKTMSEMTEAEVNQYYSGGKSEGSLNIFATWLANNKPQIRG